MHWHLVGAVSASQPLREIFLALLPGVLQRYLHNRFMFYQFLRLVINGRSAHRHYVPRPF